jgi:hypothetical protein
MTDNRDRDDWKSLLDECCVARPKDPPVYRVIVCGDVNTGKRSFVGRARDALDVKEGLRCHGAGIDYCYVDVRRSDAALLHTIEFVCVDFPSLLDVAITKDAIHGAVVVFLCDVTQPRTSVDAISTWARAVNQRCVEVLGDGCVALRNKRLAVCTNNSKTFADFAPTNTVSNPENAMDRDIRTFDSVCLLPCLVGATKADLLDKIPSKKVLLAKPDEETTALGFLRDMIRTAAIELGADFACLHSSGGSNDMKMFFRALVGHLANLASSNSSYPSIDSLRGAVGFELAPAKFIPCGLDTAKVLPVQIALRSNQGPTFPLASVFPSDDASPRGESRKYETHEQLLRGVWQGASPSRKNSATEENEGDLWEFMQDGGMP